MPLTDSVKLLDLAEETAAIRAGPATPGAGRTQRNALRADRHDGGAAFRQGGCRKAADAA